MADGRFILEILAFLMLKNTKIWYNIKSKDKGQQWQFIHTLTPLYSQAHRQDNIQPNERRICNLIEVKTK